MVVLVLVVLVLGCFCFVGVCDVISGPFALETTQL